MATEPFIWRFYILETRQPDRDKKVASTLPSVANKLDAMYAPLGVISFNNSR